MRGAIGDAFSTLAAAGARPRRSDLVALAGCVVFARQAGRAGRHTVGLVNLAYRSP